MRDGRTFVNPCESKSILAAVEAKKLDDKRPDVAFGVALEPGAGVMGQAFTFANQTMERVVVSLIARILTALQGNFENHPERAQSVVPGGRSAHALIYGTPCDNRASGAGQHAQL